MKPIFLPDMGLFNIIWVLGAIITQQVQTELLFSETQEQTEMLFQPMNRAYLTYSEYRICYYHEISDYFEEVEQVEHIVKTAKDICMSKLAENDKDKHICVSTVEELEAKALEVRQTQEKIYAFDHEERKKRAPLEIIGTLANSLFGILSREDADKYNTLIDETRAKSARNLNLISEQTSIIEATVNIFNETSSQFKERLANLEEIFATAMNADPGTVWQHIKSWTRDGEQETKWNKKAWELQFNSIINLAIIHLDKYEKTSTRILQTLSNLMEGNLFPFITKKQLAHNLEEIGKQLSKEEALPINPFTDSPFRLLQIGKLHSVLRQNRILTELTVPILQTTQYTLLKIIPLPFGEEQTRIISVQADMLLTDRSHQQIIPITEQEYKDCRQLNRNNIVCKQNEQILTDKNQECELMLLNNPQGTVMPSNCITKQIPTRNYFIHLHRLNTYFCKIVEPISIQLICRNFSEYHTIKANGFLEIQPGCEIKTDEFILKAHKSNQLQTEETKYIAVKRGGKTENETEEKRVTNRNEFIKSPNEDFGKLIERINRLKGKEEDARNQEWTSNMTGQVWRQKYWTISSVGMVIGILAVGSILIWKKISEFTGRITAEHRPRNNDVERRQSM